ncbi:hypothetical protein TNCT_595821 [Trichonephila clavata]|uniref:Uncharacterized protein n=1 Tax=Trichonephila clavata TaxID=2740835 RepID=A0A8X6H0R4_TRICU|nr:hypothetical protein TNCT_595821 [Trichonephila clavata]
MDWGNSNTVEEALNIIITSKISCESELNHLHNQIGILRDENNKLNKELQHTVSVKREEEDLFEEHKEKHKDLHEKLINCLKKIEKLESNEQNLNVEKLDLQKELKIRNNNIIELTQLQEENERLKRLVEQLNQNKNEINANYNKKYYELTKTISDNNTVIENLETKNKRIKEKLEIESKSIEENLEIENKRIEENLDDEEQYTEEIKANKKRKVNINVLNESKVLYTVNKMENDTLHLDQIISLFLNLYVHLSDLYFKHKCDSRLLNTEKALFRIEKLIEELDENKTELTYEYILAQFVHLEILTITDLKFEMKNPKNFSVEELLNASLKSSSMYIDSVFEKINNSLKVIIKAFDENRIEFHENNVELMLKTYFLLKNKFQSQKIEISYENIDHLLSMYNTIQGALKTKKLEETLSKLIILQNKISSLFEKYKKEERDKSFSDWLFDQLETISKSFSKVRSGYKKL